MKVKYFYQQFGSHMSVIIVAMIVLSILFTHYLEKFIYENKIEELTSYGESILTELETSRQGTKQILQNYGNVLVDQDIYFSLFDENSRIIYAMEGKRPNITLDDKEWVNITRGEKVTVKKDFTRFSEGTSYVLLPYMHNEYFIGGILLAAPIKGMNKVISTMNKYMFLTVLVTLIVALVLSWILAKIYVTRINRIKNATSKVAAGDYDIRIPSSHFDEIGELSHDFNDMVEKLQLSMVQIEQLETRRRQFMADVSHELRTPLTTIYGILEGIENDMIPESEKKQGLELASKEAKRLIRLVIENLDYEKIKSNQVTLHQTSVRVRDVFETIQDQLEPFAKEKHNIIQIDASNQAVVYADYDRLMQILINIVKNSIQFTENGTIEMQAKEIDDATIITIVDTGVGMQADDVEKIWQRFYKSGTSRSNNVYGEFGLGLSIVKQLVTLHGGSIEVKSEVDQGTTFTISLPKKDTQ